jgi:hypothetical protein
VQKVKSLVLNYGLSNITFEPSKHAFTPKNPKVYGLYFGQWVLFYDSKVSFHNFEDFRVFIFYDCHNNPIASHLEFQIKTYMVV